MQLGAAIRLSTFEFCGTDVSLDFFFLLCLKGIMGVQLAQSDDISIMNNAWGLDLGCWELAVRFPERFT